MKFSNQRPEYRKFSITPRFYKKETDKRQLSTELDNESESTNPIVENKESLLANETTTTKPKTTKKVVVEAKENKNGQAKKINTNINGNGQRSDLLNLGITKEKEKDMFIDQSDYKIEKSDDPKPLKVEDEITKEAAELVSETVKPEEKVKPEPADEKIQEESSVQAIKISTDSSDSANGGFKFELNRNMSKDYEKFAFGDLTLISVNIKRCTLEFASGFQSFVMEALEGGATKLIIDLSVAEIIDTTFLGALVVSLKETKKKDGELSLVCGNQEQSSILLLTSMDRIFTMHQNLNTAIGGYFKANLFV